MKKLLTVFLILGSISVSARTKEKVTIEITADTKELCQFTSDSVYKGDVEGDLRETGAYVKSVTACNKGLDGKYRKSVKFIRPVYNN